MELSKEVLEIAEEEFRKRYVENSSKKKIDNADLPAGSPMYYYCHGCGCVSAILPESWWGSGPAKYCEPCELLAPLGVLPRLKQESIQRIQEAKTS